MNQLNMKPFVGRSTTTSKLPPAVRDKNTPHFMSDLAWLPQWTPHESIRELLANMYDQSVSVQRMLYPADTPTGPLVTTTITTNGLRYQMVIFDQHTNMILSSATLATLDTCKLATTRTLNGERKSRIDSTYNTARCEMLEIINYSSRIAHESLRNGVSSKRGDKSAIGTHGEGLTGACVVLARNGCNMYVDCVANNYTAEIISYGKAVYYQMTHLHHTKTNVIQPLPKVDSGLHEVRIRVIFPPTNSVNIKQVICSVQLTDDVEGIRTERGTLLTHPEHVGTQYNRNFFVSKTKSCMFGYDFTDPDKKLLKGRDRNVHSPDDVVEECGRILSDAILSPNVSPAIHDKLLRYWCPCVFPDGPKEYAPPTSRYRDLEDGECLYDTAVQCLRLHARSYLQTASSIPIFCGRITRHLRNIAKVLNRDLVESHHVLHNDIEAVGQFEEKLCNASRPLAPESLVLKHVPELCTLLNCDHIFGVDMDTLDQLEISFWAGPGKTVYVLGDHLLNESTLLTQNQQVSIFDTIGVLCNYDTTKSLHVCNILLKVFRTSIEPPVVESSVPLTCSICFEHISPELEYTTSCNHTFHRNCIAGIHQPKCPNCRHDLSNDVDPPFQINQLVEIPNSNEFLPRMLGLMRPRQPAPGRIRHSGVRIGAMEMDAMQQTTTNNATTNNATMAGEPATTTDTTTVNVPDLEQYTFEYIAQVRDILMTHVADHRFDRIGVLSSLSENDMFYVLFSTGLYQFEVGFTPIIRN